MDAGRPLAQDCLAPLIDSPSGHYTNTGTHSSSLWLSFLAIVTARESSGTHLRSAQWHEYALPCLFTQDTLDGTNGVRIIEVPLYTISLWDCKGPTNQLKEAMMGYGVGLLG